MKWRPHAEGDADMPSQAMEELIDTLRDRQKATAGRAAPALEEGRAAARSPPEASRRTFSPKVG
jgi:hypothetical protein